MTRNTAARAPNAASVLSETRVAGGRFKTDGPRLPRWVQRVAGFVLGHFAMPALTSAMWLARRLVGSNDVHAIAELYHWSAMSHDLIERAKHARPEAAARVAQRRARYCAERASLHVRRAFDRRLC